MDLGFLQFATCSAFLVPILLFVNPTYFASQSSHSSKYIFCCRISQIFPGFWKPTLMLYFFSFFFKFSVILPLNGIPFLITQNICQIYHIPQKRLSFMLSEDPVQSFLFETINSRRSFDETWPGKSL
jgi:hypothetical protein